jgi:hypothetical protein
MDFIDTLEFVAEMDRSSGSHEFDLMRVFKSKETGRLFYGADSGCSCPSPFERVSSLADLTPITDSPDSWASFVRAAEEFPGPKENWGNQIGAKEIQDFIAKVKAALGETSNAR